MPKTFIIKKKEDTLIRSQKSKRWSDEELTYLKENYKKKANKYVAKDLNRTVSAVTLKASELGLTTKKSYLKVQKITDVVVGKPEVKGLKQNSWSKSETKFLKENYGKISSAKIAKELGRSVGSISGKAYGLHLSSKRISNKYRAWTEEEVKYLSDNYGVKSHKTVAKYLKRSKNSVIAKARDLKLTGKVVRNQSTISTSAVTPVNSVINPWILGTIVTTNILTLASIAYLILVH